ncbi:MAG: hypothetical protein CFH30_00336 [Alphaproteobacteria bacterium MarineAlpha8_Bin1]|nr:MAG: hypothetical protein CFH30_00336 [Alphaproteobacteria bacterium MarineAlpha8_Bin1]
MPMTRYSDFFREKKFFLIFIFILFVYLISLYSGPVVNDEKQSEYNARNIVINDYLGFSISSDTGNYMRLANNPSLLFENERYVKDRKLTAGNVGLSRPASFITVYLISKPIEKMLNLLSFSNQKIFDNIKNSLNSVYRLSGIDQTVDDTVSNLENFVSTYLAWIIFNIIIIFLAFFLFCKSLKISVFKMSSYSHTGLWLGVFFIINDITKIYFVSPSPAILTLLAVSLTIFSCELIKGNSRLKILLWFSFLFGFLNLFYEIFFAPFIVMIIFYMKIKFFDNKKKLAFFFSEAKFYFFCILLFLIPYLFWVGIVEIFFGGFFHFGVHDNPGFRILKNDFLTIFTYIINFAVYGYSLAVLSLFPIIFIFIFLLFYYFFTKKVIEVNKDYLLIGIIYTFTILLFFSIYGQIGVRHTLGTILIFLPLIYSILPSLDKTKEGRYIFFTAGFFLIYSFFVARKVFPFGEGILRNPLI